MKYSKLPNIQEDVNKMGKEKLLKILVLVGIVIIGLSIPSHLESTYRHNRTELTFTIFSLVRVLFYLVTFISFNIGLYLLFYKKQ